MMVMAILRKRIGLPMIKWATVPELSVWDLDDDGDFDITLSRAGHLYVGVAVQILENQGSNKFDSQLHVLLRRLQIIFQNTREMNGITVPYSCLRF